MASASASRALPRAGMQRAGLGAFRRSAAGKVRRSAVVAAAARSQRQPALADNGGGNSGGSGGGGSGGGSSRGDEDGNAGGPSANTLSLVALLGTAALDLAAPPGQHAGARQQQPRVSARSLRRGVPLVDAVLAALAGVAAIAAACRAASAVLGGLQTGGTTPSTDSRFAVAAILLPRPSAADSAPCS